MRRSLEREGDVEVVGEAGDGHVCIELVERVRPDVVLLDLSMPGTDGLEAIPAIREVSPRSAIVIFSGFGADRMRDLALELGAFSYVEKGETMDRLLVVVRNAAEQARD